MTASVLAVDVADAHRQAEKKSGSAKTQPTRIADVLYLTLTVTVEVKAGL